MATRGTTHRSATEGNECAISVTTVLTRDQSAMCIASSKAADSNLTPDSVLAIDATLPFCQVTDDLRVTVPCRA